MAVGSGDSDDILSIIQASARKGTLLSSCQPEVKELMHQLDILISARCGELKGEVARLQALLAAKDEQIQVLQASLSKKESEIEQVKGEAGSRERAYRARCADYEAQLVRLRSQVTRISQSYEQLRDKRRHHQNAERSNVEGSDSSTKIVELKEAVERARHTADVANTELKKALETIRRLESKQSLEETGGGATLTNQMLEEISSHIEERMKSDDKGTSLHLAPPEEIDKLLQQVLDKHLNPLKLELILTQNSS